MKYNHKNLELIENWLTDNDKTISFNDDFVREVYHSVLEHMFDLKDVESIKHRERGFSLQYDFVRRDLVKIYHKINGSSKDLFAGYVYLITNPAWPDYVKIGSSIDVNDRLNTYQTSSPLRDYNLEDYYFVWDRREEESYWHSLYPDRCNEWVKCDLQNIKFIFSEKKKSRIIRSTEDKLYEVKDRKNNERIFQVKNWNKILYVEDDTQ